MMDNAFTTGIDRKLQSTPTLFTNIAVTFKTVSCMNLWFELAYRLASISLVYIK